MAVLRPLKVTITSWPAGHVEWVEAPFWPHDVPREGSRRLPLGREVFIERSDFSETPPADWMRLRPGGEVRLRNACLIRCDEIIKDPVSGDVVELRCTHLPNPPGGSAGGKRRKSATIQWVSAAHAVTAEVRLYDRLFTVADPEAGEGGKTFHDYLNPHSVEIVRGCLLEPGMADTPPGERFQFVRHGYFIADAVDSKPGALVFDRIIELRDTYKEGRSVKAGAAAPPAAKPAPRPAEPKGKDSVRGGTISDGRARARAGNASLSRRYDSYIRTMGLPPELADVLTGDPAVSDFFDAAVAAHPNARSIANWTANDVLRELKGRSIGELPFSGAELADLVRRVDEGGITMAAAKAVFAEMMAGGGAPSEIIRRRGLDQAFSDADLSAAIEATLAAMPDKVASYRAGKTSLLALFTGQVMNATGGKADPRRVQERIRRKLG
jgi:glutaminyl-tRNA synthetase